MSRVDKDAIRSANPVERVIPELLGEQPIEVAGELKVRCPWHEDQRPSLRINPRKQTWFCDPCDKGGDVFAFVQAFKGGDFREALALLGERSGTSAISAAPAARRIVATYDYQDEAGVVLYQTVRYAPKDFRQRRPDGHGGWIWNLDGVRRVLYRLPELQGREAVLVLEGEKDVDRAWQLGLPATCNVGGAGKWRDEYAQQLADAGIKRIVGVPDQDDPGRSHADQVARSGLAAGLTARVATLPDVLEKGDLSDYLATHGKADLLALLKTVPAYQPAALPVDPSPTSPSTPKGRKAKPKDTAGRGLQLTDPEPWPEAMAGDTLLSALSAFLATFVVFAHPAYADVLALWIAHTYLMDAWWISPLAVANSPTMRCGKTTLLQLVAHLTSRPLPASNISPAALFRAIERFRPTLILDEAETYLKDNEELRGLVNAGHTRKTAVVIRTVGEQHEAAVFSTWCPKFLALIGRLPATLMDRALVIPMRRRMPGESVERLRLDRLEARCVPLCRQLVRWAGDHGADLRDADPTVPPELDDRAADNWRPLLAIADAAGEAWARRGRDAARLLTGSGDREESSLSIQLLADLRDILDDRDTGNAIASAELVRQLVALDDRPWASAAKHDRPLTPNGLARLLKPFGISPGGTLRIGDKVVKGYRVAVFEDAWKRYLPSPPPFQPLQRNKPNNDGPESTISQPLHVPAVTVAKSEISSITTGLCYGVTVGDPLEGANGNKATDVTRERTRF